MKSFFYLLLVGVFSITSGYVQAQDCGCPDESFNLVNNPHFSDGNVAFSSNLNFSSECENTSYSIETQSSDKCEFDDWIPGLFDHTQMNQEGLYMVIDGSEEPSTTDKVWRQRVSVLEGNEYTFSFWLRPSVTTKLTKDLRLGLFVNNTNISGTIDPSESNDWEKHCATWVADVSGLVVINIRQLENFEADAFDYGIDDIFFGTCGPPVQPCAANAFFNYSFSDLDCSFDFQYLGSSSSPIATVSHSWSFGDGQYSSELNPSHTYTSAGDYEVCLTMFNADEDGCCTDTYCETVKVECTNRECDLDLISVEWGPGSGFPGLEFFAHYTSSNPTVGFLWDFGDGTTSTEPSPIHEFTTTGFIDICLTMIAEGEEIGDCCTDTECTTIWILGPQINPLINPDQDYISIANAKVSTLHISPNPASDELFIKFFTEKTDKQYQLSITNLQGRTVKKWSGNSEGNMKTISVNSEELTPGVYFVHLQINGELRTEKLIIQ